MVTVQHVLAFWFGDGDRDDASINEAKRPLWWGHAPETDAEITERFGDTLEAAGRGELDAWTKTPQGRLALVIVLDQFSRNIHRGTGKMYAHDERAVRLVREALAHGEDAALAFFEKLFLYMPLMHTETSDGQAHCVRLFEQLVADAPTAALRGIAENTLDYAVRHRDIVDRFGRFPHRNALLGRESTAEEEEFLEQPGSSF